MNAAIPSGIIIHVFSAAGREAENNKSVAPAEKENPARNPNKAVTVTKIPYNNA